MECLVLKELVQVQINETLSPLVCNQTYMTGKTSAPGKSPNCAY